MTYLELVNNVLQRLRETEVSAVTDNAYSKMIGIFVNDAKQQVEDAYNWAALSNTISVDTAPGVFSYALTDVGQGFTVLDVFNDTDNYFMRGLSTSEATAAFLSPTTTGSPSSYYFNGIDSNGDTIVDIYPIPNNIYSLRFNVLLPQQQLVNNTDKLYVPYQPVLYLAYAKALAERGEDGGLSSNEAYGLYRQALSNAIAIEASRYGEKEEWSAV